MMLYFARNSGGWRGGGGGNDDHDPPWPWGVRFFLTCVFTALLFFAWLLCIHLLFVLWDTIDNAI